MLTSFRIQGFKAWKDSGAIRMAPITAFFGTNSSGKTSLLQFLLMLKQTAASADRTQVLELGGERSLVELGTYFDILHRESAALNLGEQSVSELKWDISWSLPDTYVIPDPEHVDQHLFESDTMRFEAAIAALPEGGVEVENMQYQFGSARFGMVKKKGQQKAAQYNLTVADSPNFQPKRTRGRAWDLPPPSKCYGFPDQARGYFQNTAFLSDLELRFEEMLSGIHYLGPLRERPSRQYSWGGSEPADMGRRGEAAIAALLASRRSGDKIALGKGRRSPTIEEHVASWLETLGLLEDFKVEEIAKGSNLYRVAVRDNSVSAQVLLTDVGFGISQVLPVLVLAFYAPRGSTVILEQPELHLHPSVQSKLADVIIEAAALRDIQFIIESHSEHFLIRLQRRIAEGTLQANDAALYFCERRGSSSKVTPLEMDEFGNIKNWPAGFFGDAFADREAAVRAGLARKRQSAI